ncbi:hypothetical protein AB595_24035 [Massilia sp. WF1]|uniref:hypothetical protein n=1 Tax=unclassified Massilia TaxID=2609279 RepID=UPI00068CD521|nr:MULTISPECIES: hypothetical protein [unclassified Massilia]ALK95771.1 hypothetical protein AM586_05230 [Massilia sp. WG5]KNZ68010.1 hypothetical protein AB595_24035 [Massilia sp. WF1]
MNPRTVGGLAALFLATALPATAATGPATASATIGNFSYRLIDLTPNDGQTPSLRLGTWSSDPFAIIFSDTAYRNQLVQHFRHDDGDVSVQFGDDVASAGMTLQNGHAAVGIGDRSGRAEASSFAYFDLSPNTRLEFLAYATGSTAVGAGEQAYADAGLSGKRFAGSATPETDIYDMLFTNQPGSRERWVEVDVTSGADPVSGYMTVVARAGASSLAPPTTPVPEPAHAAMLLAGLLLLLPRLRPGFRAPA